MIIQKILFRRYIEQDEDLLYVVHKHWIEIIGVSLKTAFFGFFLPWMVWYFISDFFWIAVVWSVIFWFWYLYHFIDWYFDVWLVTDVSIIDIEWMGLFHRLSSRIPYTEVREIGWEMKGFWAVVLRYGDISIGMATGGKVSLEGVSRPKKVEKKIVDIRDHYLSQKNLSDASSVQALLSEVVAQHIQENGLPRKKRL